MSSTITDISFQKISDLISSKLGIYFPDGRQKDLEKGLLSAANDFNFDSLDEFIKYLIETQLSKENLQLLSKHLTIGETYFFREKVTFDLLRNILLPDIIRKRLGDTKKIKIWSAGCSSGEEPFSIAIILNEIIDCISNWDITVLGTDINMEMLKKAQTGKYSEWSFREIQPRIKDKYFRITADNKYELDSNIKKIVEFNYLNLVDENYPSLLNKTNAVDILLCRNVLMYFDQKDRDKVISRLYNSIADGGWLILGLTEVGYLTDKRFKQIVLKDAIIFQKKEVIRNKIVARIKIPSETKTEKKIPAYKHKKEFYKDIFLKAITSYNDGNYVEAIELLKELLTNPSLNTSIPENEKEEALYFLSMSLANSGLLTPALEWCDKGILKNKLNPSLYFLKSNLLQALNRPTEAIESLRKSIFLDSDYTMAHFSIANIYRRVGRSTESNKHFKIVIDILKNYSDEDIVKDSGGLTANRIKEMINSFITNM